MGLVQSSVVKIINFGTRDEFGTRHPGAQGWVEAVTCMAFHKAASNRNTPSASSENYWVWKQKFPKTFQQIILNQVTMIAKANNLK